MKHNIKRKFSFAAILMMWALILCGIPVFASEINGDMDLSEGAQPFVETPENYNILQQNTNKMLTDKKPRYAYKVLDVTCFKQENGYYCGPTTVKQVLHYLNGSSLTQSKYAEKLGTTTAGTDMTVIPGVLNNLTSKHSYAYSGISDVKTWKDRIESDTISNIPVILDINTNNNSAWPYKTSGHFINTSGYNYQAPVQQVRITDPYEKGLGNHWYTVEVLYDVNNAHFRKAMIW